MTTKSIFLASILTLFAACAPGTQDLDLGRGPIGKADSVGTCEASCGDISDANDCWCDDLCATFGDCCGDIEDFCPGLGPVPSTCFGSDTCDGDTHCSTDDGVCDTADCPDGFACPAVCSGTCVPNVDVEEPEGCFSTDDCAADTHCSTDDGVCDTIDCPDGLACPAVCAGTCVPDVDVEEPDSCFSSDSCAADTHCSTDDGVCETADCPDGLNCPTVCFGTCVPDVDVEESCFSTDDCAVDTHCSTDDGVCDTFDCPDGFACPAVCAGTCVPDQGEQCGTTTCAAGTECCNALDGICVLPGMACTF